MKTLLVLVVLFAGCKSITPHSDVVLCGSNDVMKIMGNGIIIDCTKQKVHSVNTAKKFM